MAYDLEYRDGGRRAEYSPARKPKKTMGSGKGHTRRWHLSIKGVSVNSASASATLKV